VQLIPGGSLVTVPAPSPARTTVTTGLAENVVVTVWSAESVTLQVEPAQVAPVQPAV